MYNSFFSVPHTKCLCVKNNMSLSRLVDLRPIDEIVFHGSHFQTYHGNISHIHLFPGALKCFAHGYILPNVGFSGSKMTVRQPMVEGSQDW